MTNEKYYQLITQSFYTLLEDISEVTNYKHKRINREKFTPIDLELEPKEFVKPSYSMYYYHFHIKELPGWLFGVWLYKPKALDGCYDGKGNISCIKGTWFCAIEKFVDKFKPTRVHFSGDFVVDINGGKLIRCDGYPESWFSDALLFIKEHKYIATYYDYFDEGIHQNVSGIKAFIQYYKLNYNYWKENATTKFLDYLSKKIYAKYCFYGLKNAHFYDYGENRSPRYEMRCPYISNEEEFVDGDGWYYFDDEFYDHLDKKMRKVKFLARLLGRKWYCAPISNGTYVYETMNHRTRHHRIR